MTSEATRSDFRLPAILRQLSLCLFQGNQTSAIEFIDEGILRVSSGKRDPVTDPSCIEMLCLCLPHLGTALTEDVAMKLASSSFLEDLSAPKKWLWFSSGLFTNPLECLLDCPRIDWAKAILDHAPCRPDRRQWAAVIRRSDGAEHCRSRLSACEQLGGLDRSLLTSLARHSSWCSNEVGSLALARLEQMSLSRIKSKETKPSARRI